MSDSLGLSEFFFIFFLKNDRLSWSEDDEEDDCLSWSEDDDLHLLRSSSVASSPRTGPPGPVRLDPPPYI